MADKIEDGGPAFPVECYFSKDGSVEPVQTSGSTGWAPGLSMRDYFAGQALAGSSAAATGVGNMPDDVLRQWAETCYRVADAMISARKGDA